MKKVLFVFITLLSVIMLFGCSEKKFDLNEYGFENNNGMTKWIEITSYDFGKGYAEFDNEHTSQFFLDFKENSLISSWRTNKQKDATEQALQKFEKLDNDTALIDDKPFLITKRIVDNDMLIIMTLRDKKESYFVLEHMVEANQNEGETSKYYFK